MSVKSNPLHCTLVFDFLVNGRNFMVSFYQDLTTDDKMVTVSNPDGTPVEDQKLCDVIAKYTIEKYSITYDPGEDTQDDVKLDSAI
jgi:hypothetical protein